MPTQQPSQQPTQPDSPLVRLLAGIGATTIRTARLLGHFAHRWVLVAITALLVLNLAWLFVTRAPATLRASGGPLAPAALLVPTDTPTPLPTPISTATPVPPTPTVATAEWRSAPATCTAPCAIGMVSVSASPAVWAPQVTGTITVTGTAGASVEVRVAYPNGQMLSGAGVIGAGGTYTIGAIPNNTPGVGQALVTVNLSDGAYAAIYVTCQA